MAYASFQSQHHYHFFAPPPFVKAGKFQVLVRGPPNTPIANVSLVVANQTSLDRAEKEELLVNPTDPLRSEKTAFAVRFYLLLCCDLYILICIFLSWSIVVVRCVCFLKCTH
jgi:hypothetical protein